MQTIDKPEVLRALRSRLQELSPAAEAQWGKMSVHQMLVHCADSMERVTRGERFADMTGGPSKLIKLIALKTSLPWPKGLPSGGEPASITVEDGGFEDARARTITALEAMASAEAARFSASHPAFGPMKPKDWLRWAQRHLDHHLRQFGA